MVQFLKYVALRLLIGTFVAIFVVYTFWPGCTNRYTQMGRWMTGT